MVSKRFPHYLSEELESMESQTDELGMAFIIMRVLIPMKRRELSENK